MNIAIKRSDFLDVLSKIQGLTGRKSSLAITSSLLMKTSDTGVVLAATDLETGYEGHFTAKVRSEGMVVINAKKLFEIVRDFPSEEIRINELENHWIEIGNEKVLYHIVGMNPEDFPGNPEIQDIPFFEMKSSALKKMIERSVVITGAGDDKRAHVIGVFFECLRQGDKHYIRMVSTDGSRLSKVDYALKEEMQVPFEKGVLISKKELVEVGKFLEGDEFVQMGFMDNHLVVKKEKETLVIRLLEGEFPDYSEIVDQSGYTEIVMDRNLFLMMLKRMSILSTDSYKCVIFNFKDDVLLINSTNPEIGESKEDMPIGFTGDPVEAAFNPRFFIDSLNVIEDDQVIVSIKNNEKPCYIQGAQDKSYLSVVMPMRI